MVRDFIRKTNRAQIPKDGLVRAAKDVFFNNTSRRSVARDFNIPSRTFIRFCSKVTPEQLQNDQDDLLEVHCSHKLQPLDVTVYGPLKKYVNTACDSWITNHPGSSMTIYDIPGIVKVALPLATTPNNITSGFKKTGIYPFNRDVFDESEFLLGFATDRLLNKEAENDQPDNNNRENEPPIAQLVEVGRSTNETQHMEQNVLQRTPPAQPLSRQPGSTNETQHMEQNALQRTPPAQPLSPQPGCSKEDSNPKSTILETIRPLPRAGLRKSVNSRKKCKSAILTDTPEKLALEMKKNQSKPKGKAEQTKWKLSGNGEENKKKKNKKRVKIQTAASKKSEDYSSEDEDYFCLVCVEPYSYSKPGENWIKCTSCNLGS